MAPLFVSLTQLVIASPLWFAAYHRYGFWPCAVIFLLSWTVAFAAALGKRGL